MRLKILTYVPPSKGRRKGNTAIIQGHTETRPGLEKPIKQYRRRKLPYISPDLQWMCLWIALLIGVVLVMTIVNAGAM